VGKPLVLVKVGGSLFDLPDLRSRLRDFVGALGTPRVVLFPGGGPAADVIRAYDARFGLGEEKAHWLALRALTLNAHVLAELLPPARVVEGKGLMALTIAGGVLPILDPLAFARTDERDGGEGQLPHTWDVTSDSLAARAAVVLGARRLVLLKSADAPAGGDWEEAERLGLVDVWFAQVLRQTTRPLEVQLINLRAWMARIDR
jgi:aspartokinase-like uncharacterized kinase